VSGLAPSAVERYHAVAQYDSGAEFVNFESLPYLSTPADAFAPTTSVNVGTPTASVSVGSAIPDSGLEYEWNVQELSGVSEGESVSTIPDLNKSNDLSNGNGTYRESGLNGNPAIEIVSSSTTDTYDASSSPLGTNNEYTTAIVVQWDQPGGTALENGSNTSWGLASDSSNWFVDHRFEGSSFYGPFDTSPHVHIAAYDGTNLTTNLDGVDLDTSQTAVQTPNGALRVGERDGDQYSDITFGHILTYSEYYDSNGRSELYGSLSSIWGI